MGEKEPQATSRRGVFSGSSIFFLRRDSGNRYSSILSTSPVIAWRTVDLVCWNVFLFFFKGRNEDEEDRRMVDLGAEGQGDLSGKAVLMEVEESGGGALVTLR